MLPVQVFVLGNNRVRLSFFPLRMADDSPQTARMKRYKHLWQKMDPIVHVSSAAASSSEQADQASEQSPSLLQRAAILESWAENRSVMRAS